MTPPNLMWKGKWFKMNSQQWISYLVSIELLTNGSPVLGGSVHGQRSKPLINKIPIVHAKRDMRNLLRMLKKEG